MNERIKELCSQAISDVDGIQNPDTQHMYIPDCFRDRFAELIVRECIDIVKPTQHHEAWAQSYLGGVDGLELLDSKVAKIKQHFGVGE